MYRLSLSIFAAILFLAFLKDLPPWYYWVAGGTFVACLVGIVSYFSKYLSKRCFSSCGIIFLGFIVGGAYGIIRANLIIDQHLPAALHSSIVTVYGKVVQIPDHQIHTKGEKLSFYLLVSHTKNHDFRGKIKLSWYRNLPDSLLPGDEWQLQVKLKQPNGLLNPASFDYEQYLFRQAVVASGYVIDKSDSNQLVNRSNGISVDRFRLVIADQIKATVDDPEIASVLSALTVAIKHDMPQGLWDTLRATGTSHLLAISGLHIGMIASVGFFLVRLLWFAIPKLYLVFPVQKAGLLLGAVFAMVYAALAGFSISTQRALVMVLIILLALLLQRFIALGRVLAFALFVVLLIDPFSVLDVGFWLSFIAVAMIFYWLAQQTIPQCKTWRLKLKHLIILQLLLSLAMLPLTGLFFGTASWLSPMANLLAIPWVSLLIVPFALLGVLLQSLSIDWAATWSWSIAAFHIKWLLIFLDSLAALPNSTLFLSKPPWWLLPFAMLGILLIFAPRHFPAKWLGLLLILPIFLHQPLRPQAKAFELVLLDTGQSLSSLVKTKHHNLLYDTGYASAMGFNIGERVIVPYLKATGINQLDTLVVSHLDNDHSGGVSSVLKHLVVERIHSSEDVDFISQETLLCAAGQRWQWDGVNFTYLHPELDHVYKKRNNRSCVLKVWNDHHQLLLTADVEKRAEKRMIFNQNNDLSSEVLLIPHHGSKTSSTLAFLEAVNPRLALVNSGYQNRFGFPKPSIMQRYQHLNIPVLNTAEQGAISIRFPADQQAYSVQSERLDHARFWHRR